MPDFLGQPGAPETFDLFANLTPFMDMTIRTLDPTAASYLSQVVTDDDGNSGYPWERSFKYGHIYPVAYQDSNPSEIINNKPTIGGSVRVTQRRKVKSTLTHARQYLGLEVDNDTQAVATAGQLPDIFLDLLQEATHAKTREEQVTLYGDGTGVRAKVGVTQGGSAAVSGSVTFLVQRQDLTNNRYAGQKGARNLWRGLSIRFYRNGAPLTTGSASYLITEDPRVGYDDGVDLITVSPGLGFNLAEGDEIVFGTDTITTYGQYPAGIKAIYDDGRDVPVWRGLSRSAYEGWGTRPEMIDTSSVAAGAAGYFRQLDTILLTNFLAKWNRTTRLTRATLLANPEIWREIPWGGALHTTPAVGTVVPVTEQQIGPAKSEGHLYSGVRTYTFYHDAVEVTQVYDINAEPNQIEIIFPENLKRRVMHDWRAIENGVPIPGTDRRRLTMARRYGLDEMGDGSNGGRLQRLKQKDYLEPVR